MSWAFIPKACYVQRKVEPGRPQGQGINELMSAVHCRFQRSALVVLKGWNQSQWSPTSHLLVGLSLLPVQGKDKGLPSVKSCIADFHVICAFEHSLEMKTILDERDEVKFKSFYLKHSQNRQNLGRPSTPCTGLQSRARPKARPARKHRSFGNWRSSIPWSVWRYGHRTGLPTVTVDFITSGNWRGKVMAISHYFLWRGIKKKA